MLQSLQDTNPNIARTILRRILPVVVVVFLVYVIFIGITVYKTTENNIASSHNQANAILQAKLISELKFLILENQEFTNTGQLRSQADQILANDASINALVNNLFADLIRLNSSKIERIQYVASNGAILNEVINERGIPFIVSSADLPRTEPDIITSDAFQVARQSITADDFFISDFTLTQSLTGRPIIPLHVIFSVYVPVFDLENPREPLGVVRFEIAANSILDIINNPILNEGEIHPGRQFFLIDNQGNVVADSNAPSQDYLYHLIDQELEEEEENLHDIVGDFVARTNGSETTLHTEGGILFTIREFQTEDSQNTIWRLVITDSQGTLYSQFVLSMLLVIGLTIGVILLLLYLINRRVLSVLMPIMNISQQAQQIASGRPSATTVESSLPTDQDEIGVSPISSALETLTERIQKLSTELSEQSTRHNRDMQIITNIGRETATLYDINFLMQRSIELICNELGFYHAQIFLVDDAKVNAVLVKSRGEAGRKLLEIGHKLAIGSESIIGTVTSQGIPVIVNDTTVGNTLHGVNPFLPDTLAEMALPLFIGTEIIGALDIQSTETNVFHHEDLPTFQLIADQLAVAINNAQLRNQTDQTIEQINYLNRQLTRKAWTEAEDQLGLQLNYTYDLMDIQTSESTEIPEGTILAPIYIRGEAIGTLSATPPVGQSFSEGDQAVIRAVAERVALAIENARLFQETQVVLSETEVLYELSRKLSKAISYDDIINSIVESVAPDATGGQIWFFDDYMLGEKPEWANLATSDPIQYTDNTTFTNNRLHLTQYRIFNRFAGNNILTIPDIESDLNVTNGFRAFMQTLNARSIVFIPLSMRGQWQGFINIYFNRKHTYSEREQRIYSALIDQAGVAIDNRLLIEQTERALQRNEKLYASSRIINTARSLQDLVYAAVTTTNTSQVDFWLGIFEDTFQGDLWSGQLHIIARSEMGNVIETDEYYDVKIPENSPIRQREPEVLSDTSDRSWMWETTHAFVSAFPLFSDNLPLALFFIVSYEDYQLSAEDYEVYRALTGQMSTQIQNSRLLEQTETALAETQRLYIASRAIAGATDIDSILESAAGHLALPFMQSDLSHRITISLIEAYPNPVRNASQMRYRFQWTSDADVPFEIPTGAIVPREDAPFADLFDSRTTSVHYRNIREEINDRPDLLRLLSQDGGQSAIISVLQTRQNWYGVLVCKNDKPYMFDDHYEEFVQAVANQIAIGIENQILFNAAQSERERLQTILSTLPTGVVVLDPRTFVPILVNESIAGLLGQSIDMQEPFTAQRYNLYRTGTDTYYNDQDLPIHTATTSSSSQMVDDLALIVEGYQVDLLLNAAPIFDNNGKQTAIVAAFQDISNLRSLEQTLQENLRETVSSYEAQRSIAQAETLDDLLDVVLVQMMLLQPHNAMILIFDEQLNKTIIARQMFSSIDSIDDLQPILPTQDIIHVKDINTHPNITPEIKDIFTHLKAQSVMMVTMRVPTRSQPLGWLMITGEQSNYFSSDEERSLTSLADMTRVAIDNRYLVQSTQVALQETRTLYAATTNITRAGDLDDLGNAIEQAILSLEPDKYVAYINMSPSQVVELFNVGFDDTFSKEIDMEILRTAKLPNHDRAFVSDIRRITLGKFGRELRKIKDIKAVAAITLQIKDMQGGRILLTFNQPRQFSDSEIRYLSSIADSASVVIDNQTLLEQIQSTLQETSVLYQSSRALADATTPTEIIDIVVNYLIGPHVHQVFVALLSGRTWDSSDAVVEIEAGWQAEGSINLEGVTLSAKQFPAWEQLSSQTVLIINDIYDDSLEIDMMQRISIESLDTRSLVVIPLRVANRPIGSVWIGSRDSYDYSDADARIFQAFAESASLSLEASYLFAQTEHRARQLETSAEVGQTIGQILDLDILLPQVVELIRQRFGYDHVQVFLMDDHDEWAVLEASTGEAGRQLLANRHKLAKGSSSVIGQVTSTAQPSIALDTADANVVHQPNEFLPLTRSEMALPLIVKGNVVGALDVQSNQPNAFSDEDVRALTTLSGQIAIAIDNANLYEEIGRRASDMGLLFDITVIATASDTLEDALQAVTDKLYEAFEASAAVFYLPEKYVDTTVLRPVTLSGSDQPLSEISEIVVGNAENLIGLAGSTLNSQLIPNINREVRYLSITPTSSTAMVVPISTGNKLIGLIVVEHTRISAFSQDDLQLVITLAGSLSAVVENSKLLDELQKTNDSYGKLTASRASSLLI